MSSIKKIGNRYYDFDPVNRSFLQTAMELKSLGIKNYYFMLRVDNPFSNVQNMDPYRKGISPQEIKALMIEMKHNIWFYARTVARIRSDAGIVPFSLHRGLAASLWCFEHNYDACLCEPRQTYKTTGIISAALTWAFQIASENSHIKFFGKETKNTKDNLMHLKNDIELLPEWLQFKRYSDPMQGGRIRKTRQAAETLENQLFHNRATITPKAASEAHAEGLARGESAAIFYMDEIEHTTFFPIILANSAPAFKTASDNAKSIGNPSSRCMSCTPGNLDTKAGREVMPIIKSMVPWTEKVYDMSLEELGEYKSAYTESYHADDTNRSANREVVDIFYIEYQYYQLRRDDRWVQEQYRLSGDRMAILREIFLQRLRGSTDSPFDQEDLQYLIQHMTKSVSDIILRRKWRFLLYPHGEERRPDALIAPGVYNPFDSRLPYIVGIDPGGGVGGDNTAITIVNPYTLQVAAEFKSPHISGTELLRLLVELVVNYMPRCVLVPEKNSMGIYLIQAILESDIRDNLYWSRTARELEELSIERGSDNEMVTMSGQYRKYSVYTSKAVRDAMFELLSKHVREGKSLLVTEYLIDDICKLVRTSTGRVEAVRGEHDDSLMSYLLAIYAYYTGDNLDFFGIDKSLHPVTLGSGDEDTVPVSSREELVMGAFSTESVNFRTLEKEAIIRDEQTTAYLQQLQPKVYGERYNPNDPFDDNIAISPLFFDMIN